MIRSTMEWGQEANLKVLVHVMQFDDTEYNGVGAGG